MMDEQLTKRAGIQRIADAISSPGAKPLGEARWAQMHSQAWDLVNRLEDENANLRADIARLRASFLTYIDTRISH
jgi:hypothetical protein